MNINNDNGKGQEKVVTEKRLSDYIDWLNLTNGGSFIRVTSGGTALGRKSITLTSMLEGLDASGNPIIKTDGIGVGTIYWTRTDAVSTPDVTSAVGSVTISGQTASRADYPRGKFYLEYQTPSGIKKFTKLDNTPNSIDPRSVTSYTGYDSMSFSGLSGDSHCVTYGEVSSGKFARMFDQENMIDGLLIDGYSVNDGKSSYSDNQLMVEKDINYGKLEHNLEIESITVEIDAMTDFQEYRLGVVPGSNDMPYIVVNDVVDNTSTRFYDFTMSSTSGSIVDNSNVSLRTYSGVTITKGNSVAKAAKDSSGNNYKVTVSWYSDSAYTLSSTTITRPVTDTSSGTQITVTASTGVHSGTSQTNINQYRKITVAILKDGTVKFDIRQRPETYGYFPVDVYKYSVDDVGNVALTAQSQFIKASTGVTVNTWNSNSLYTGTTAYSTGWLSNAGDNFGTMSLNGNKVKLEVSDKSVYDDVMESQGLSGNELLVCGKDVYNSGTKIYDRGDTVGSSYHMAYTNDAYGNMDLNTGGLKGTIHLFCSEGQMVPGTPSYECSSNYLEYTYDEFHSEYEYPMIYSRVYYKDCHSYGKTSILRRFRKINGSFNDSAISTYSTVNTTTPKVSGLVSGNSFPKHVSGKTITSTINYYWNEIYSIKSGTHNVSGWTTVFETGVTNSDITSITSSEPTERNVYVYSTTNTNRIYCEKNTDSLTDYMNIAPKFYMVDAESCSGATSSGYDFSKPKDIEDKTAGNSEIRYYKLEYDDYLTEYTNVQKKLMPMISYNNVTGNTNTVVVGSNRYGIYNKYIPTECTPQAPYQEVSWVDTYAPIEDSDGYLLSGMTLYFVDSDNKLLGGIGGSSNGVVPATYSVYNWQELDLHNDGIGVDDVNRFESGGSYNTFAGQTRYNKGTMNNHSGHRLNESISCAVEGYDGHSFAYSYDIEDKLGYEVFDSSTFGTTPLRAVSSSTVDFDGDTYTGDTYVYYERISRTNIKMKSYSSSDYSYSLCKFLPFKSKYDTYNNFALRPCNGFVTCPYWTADINFIVRHPGGYFEDPISAFDMVPSVNGVRLTTGGTTVNGIWYQLMNTTNESLSVTSDHVTKRSVYGFLTAVGSPIQDSDSSGTSQKMGLYLLFVDIPDSVYTHTVKIICNANSNALPNYKEYMNTQGLSWEMDANHENAVGATVLADLGNSGWGSFRNNFSNQDVQNGPAVIGSRNQNSVTDIIFGSTSQFPFWNFFTSLGAMYPKASQTNITKHEGLYW